MDADEASVRIERLREHRRHTPRDDAMSPSFERAAREIERLRRNLSGVAEAWDTVCPPELADRTSIRSVRRGVLTIGVADSAAMFELHGLLRSGAERALIRRCPMTVRAVRLVADAEVDGAGTDGRA